jgi:lipoprotein-releasing system permease protein
MNWTAKLVKSLLFDQNKKKSNLIFSISSFAIALSLAIMIMASFMIRGFEYTVEHKIFNFWSHYHIQPFSLANSMESKPFEVSSDMIRTLERKKQTLAVQKSILKGAILRKKDQFEGVLLKGIEIQKVKSLMSPYIKEGDFNATDSLMPIVISDKLSALLQVPLGKTCFLSFINEEKSLVKCRVVGIFHTGMDEFDKSLVLFSYIV